MSTPRLTREITSTHRCYSFAGRCLDVLWSKQGWTCVEVSIDGQAGTVLAQGTTAEEALANGVAALTVTQ